MIVSYHHHVNVIHHHILSPQHPPHVILHYLLPISYYYQQYQTLDLRFFISISIPNTILVDVLSHVVLQSAHRMIEQFFTENGEWG